MILLILQVKNPGIPPEKPTERLQDIIWIVIWKRPRKIILA